jgi:hypothetical protein
MFTSVLSEVNIIIIKNVVPSMTSEMILCACVVLVHLLDIKSTLSQTPRRLSQCVSIFTKISSFPIDSVDVECHSASIKLMENETQRQLSHHQIRKSLNTSLSSRIKQKILKSLILWRI